MLAATSRSPVKPTKRCRNTPMRLPFSVAASRPAANEPEMCAAASAVTGSSGSGPVTRSSASATSRTDFRHRADRVVVGVERHHAGAAGQPARGADGGERREAARVRQRVAGVGAEAERRQARGHRGGAAAARSGGAERRIVGVADGAADGADAEIAERELVEVGLAEHDGAALLHARRPRANRAAADDRPAPASRRSWAAPSRRCCP